ncbi:hypothetical protein CEXT_154931 [Caerostris extrusa]|uniref:Uncharacterized protein n=1 Tax=Caerostris extrusa TaxID=172846 RepID=A0AAV4MDT0_CAEEX|nr:hypothetical protein CEXT_154931 [Caerostris extrusa]
MTSEAILFPFHVFGALSRVVCLLPLSLGKLDSQFAVATAFSKVEKSREKKFQNKLQAVEFECQSDFNPKWNSRYVSVAFTFIFVFQKSRKLIRNDCGSISGDKSSVKVWKKSLLWHFWLPTN